MSDTRKSTETTISIIVPVFNAEGTLDRCLGSVCNQTSDSVGEIIVVNDGSSDSSESLVREWVSRDPRVHLLNQSNHGVAYSRNVGLREASGKYVAFVDADDYLEIDYIKRLYSVARSGHDLVVSNANDVMEDGTLLSGAKARAGVVCPYLTQGYNPWDWYAHSTVWGCLFSSELIRGDSFPLDVKVGEDTVFFYSVLRKSKSPIFIPYRGYNYVQRGSSIVHTKDWRGHYEEGIAWFRVGALLKGYPTAEAVSYTNAICCIARGKSARGTVQDGVDIDEYSKVENELNKRSFLKYICVCLVNMRLKSAFRLVRYKISNLCT